MLTQDQKLFINWTRQELIDLNNLIFEMPGLNLPQVLLSLILLSLYCNNREFKFFFDSFTSQVQGDHNRKDLAAACSNVFHCANICSVEDASSELFYPMFLEIFLASYRVLANYLNHSVVQQKVDLWYALFPDFERYPIAGQLPSLFDY